MYPLRPGGRLSPKKLFTLLLSCISITCTATVVCVWDQSRGGYVCSGEGQPVEIYGGGSFPDGVPVVTNIVGVCTNCTDIAPETFREKLDAINVLVDDVDETAQSVEGGAIYSKTRLQDLVAEIDEFRSYPYPSGNASSVRDWVLSVTNSPTPQFSYAMESVGETLNYTQSVLYYGRSLWGAAQGIYTYSQEIKPTLNDQIANLNAIESDAERIQDSAASIRELTAYLYENSSECTNTVSNSPSIPGSGTTGDRWCTEEQGDAIISLLQELSELSLKQRRALEVISNNTVHIRHTLQSGLFSDYTHIPEGTEWREVYHAGTSTPWGYSPTNTLERIEMILYGIADSLATNSNAFTQSELSEDTIEDAVNEVVMNADDLDDISTDADAQAPNNLGAALRAFFEAFSVNGRQLREGDEVIPSIEVSVGNATIEVPAIAVAGGSDLYNSLQSAFSSLMAALYYVIAGWLAFVYWRWFGGKCVLFSKWAIEFVSSMFT